MPDMIETRVLPVLERVAELLQRIHDRLGPAARPITENEALAASTFRALERGFQFRPPLILEASPASSNEVRLAWRVDDPAMRLLRGSLLRSQAPDWSAFTEIRALGPADRDHVDAGRAPSTKYLYRLTAEPAGSPVPWHAQTTATTPA